MSTLSVLGTRVRKERKAHTMAFSKKLLICTIVILSLAIIAGALPIHGESEIYDTVVRLHVLANSDTEEDQALKLKVRDTVIGFVTPYIEECRTQEDAIAAIEPIIGEIESAARNTVLENGYDYSVSVTLSEEYYPTRTYETCAFPSGKYTSLRILIGESAGQNWWCCLFPPLCLSAATPDSEGSNEDAFISVGLTSDQYKLITESDKPKYRVRFKILEALYSLFGGS